MPAPGPPPAPPPVVAPPPRPQPPPAEEPPAQAQQNPQAAALFADLWMQTSAEYEALCLQTFHNAEEAVIERLANPTEKPPAVVMDLDETVIDNLGYQAHLYKAAQSYQSSTWDAWVRAQAEGRSVRAVPGAVDFIRAAEAAGANVVFVSNRRETVREPTIRTLERLGVWRGEDAEGKPRLLLQQQDSSKEPRREQVRAAYTIVALLGDNLADLAQEFEAESPGDASRRRNMVRRASERWGEEWFVLPNPAYGDWVQALENPLEDNLEGPERLP